MIDALIGLEWEPQLTLLQYSKIPVFVNELEYGPITNIKIRSDKRSVRVWVNSYLFKKYSVSYDPPISHSYLSTDTVKNNLEARSFPVPIGQLEGEITKCEESLSNFILKLKQHVDNGIGVFLPKAELEANEAAGFIDTGTNIFRVLYQHTPSKHINISFKKESDIEVAAILTNIDALGKILYDSSEYGEFKTFRSFIRNKPSKIGYTRRLHITVPYNFTDYEYIIELSKILWYATPDCWFERYIKIVSYLDNWAKKNPQKEPILVSYIKADRYIKVRGLI